MKSLKSNIALIAPFLLFVVLGVFVFPVVANSDFVAHLKGVNEVPSVDTKAQGQAIFHVSADGTMIRYKLIVANIHNVVAAHIHLAPAGVNGPIVVFLYGPALIEGRFQGVLATGTFTAANLVGPLAGMPLSALISEMMAGNTYVNVHTTQNPGGEVRGQIMIAE